jgi:hypothetical protein
MFSKPKPKIPSQPKDGWVFYDDQGKPIKQPEKPVNELQKKKRWK